MNELRPNTLVQLIPAARKQYQENWTQHDFLDDHMQKTLFLGEIQNMQGHGIFVTGNGKVYYGSHIDDFEEVVDDDYIIEFGE